MCITRQDKKEVISNEVDSLIAQEELPNSPYLKVVSRFDDLYPEDEDEREAYFDFVNWYLSLDYLPILSLPSREKDFWYPPKELDEKGNDVSQFNTRDFMKKMCKVPVDQWKTQQTFDRLYDLAQTHSCLSTQEGRAHIKKVFDEIVFVEFIEKFNATLQKIAHNHPKLNRRRALNDYKKYCTRIVKACKIWNDTAFQV